MEYSIFWHSKPLVAFRTATTWFFHRDHIIAFSGTMNFSPTKQYFMEVEG
jgi:hypothetical protein